MFSPKHFVFPTFEENLFHIISLFSDEVAGLRGGGPFKSPREHEVSIVINGWCLDFESFGENASLVYPQTDPVAQSVAESIAPVTFSGLSPSALYYPGH